MQFICDTLMIILKYKSRYVHVDNNKLILIWMLGIHLYENTFGTNTYE